MKTQGVEKNKIYIADRLGFSDFDDCLSFPKFIEVETIRACNARCTFCSVYNGSFEAKPKKMEDSLLEKIIDELKRPGATTSTVCACRDGEPLLDRRVAGFIKGLKGSGIPTVTLVTNAELLNEKKSKELLSSGLDELMISIDGYSEEVYSKLRIGLDFDTVFRNTITCYDPDDSGRSSGKTGADVERIEAFVKLGRKDPIEYQTTWETLKATYNSLESSP